MCLACDQTKTVLHLAKQLRLLFTISYLPKED